MNSYTSSLDKTSKVVTCFVAATGIFCVIMGYMGYVGSGREAGMLIAATIGPVIVLVLLVGAYFYRPRAIILDGEGVGIDRKAGRVTIRYAHIKSIRSAEEGDMKYTLRVMGNGGVFGYTGWFYNKKLGRMRLYCSQRKNYVIIDQVDGKRIIISPDDPAQMLNDAYLSNLGIVTH